MYLRHVRKKRTYFLCDIRKAKKVPKKQLSCSFGTIFTSRFRLTARKITRVALGREASKHLRQPNFYQVAQMYLPCLN